MSITAKSHFYSIVIAVHPKEGINETEDSSAALKVNDWRLGEIKVDWVDFTREKVVDQTMPPTPAQGSNPAQTTRKRGSGTSRPIPGSGTGSTSKPTASATAERKKKPSSSDPDALSLQPLLAHFPGPNPLDSSVAQGVSEVGRGVVHLFRHAPPAHLIASLESHPVGEGSGSAVSGNKDEWGGESAEGEDGSLIAILAVPAWMRPADFLEFIGGWSTCLEGVRMIR
jgi:BRCA1-associated protein